MKNDRYRKLIKEHEKWLESNKSEGKQLILRGEDLSFINIKDKNLNESVFIDCNLQRAFFDNVTLHKAYFKNNRFHYSYIINVDIKNSIFQNNIFNGAYFESTSWKETGFKNNTFRSATFKELSFNDSTFEENKYLYCELNNVSYENALIQKENISETRHEKVVYSGIFFNSVKITNSTFFDSMLDNSYLLISEENNIYFNTTPKNFFKGYRNKSKENYIEISFDEIVKKIKNFENSILNEKISDKDYISNIQKSFIDKYIQLDKIKYQIFILDRLDNKYTSYLKDIKERLSYLESIIVDKLNIFRELDEEGKDNE